MMKKFLCFALIIMSMFSCLIFSACGNEFEKLSMTFYSSAGERIDELNFVIDSSKEDCSQRISIQFDGIEQDQIGQIKVYSLPNELVIDSNYVYAGNTCYVDINPVKPNNGDAKLVVSHLASGKKAEIELNIEQKSENVNILNSQYIISIPENESQHIVDFSKLVSLMPVGSTDKIYFKIISNDMSIEPIEIADLENVYSGFVLSNSIVNNSSVKIYPVTYIDGYENGNLDKYQNKIIDIRFRKTVQEAEYSLVSTDGFNITDQKIQLLANATSLNSFKLSLLFRNDLIFSNSRADRLTFHDLYQIEVLSEDEQKISAFTDKNNDVVIVANIHTEDFLEIEVALKPINFVGDIARVSKKVLVKGDVKADDIEIKKNDQVLEASDTNIFDYYEEGNALGALFSFKAVSNNGTEVHQDLNKMRILVKEDILCRANRGYDITNEKRFTLMIHLYNEYLKFEYDANLGCMVSEEITQENRIYIKYVKGDELKEESDDFSIRIVTVNNSGLENWQSLKNVDEKLSFNRVEGVKTMAIEVGKYEKKIDAGGLPYGEGTQVGDHNPEYVYLNRLEGLDSVMGTIKYVRVPKDSVLSVQGTTIPRVEFKVSVTAMGESTNNLKILTGICDVDRDVVDNAYATGSDSVLYIYNNEEADYSSQFISLIFRADTDLGDYKITFYQEDIEKSSLICKVYEDITELTDENIEIETNKKAFKNIEYTDNYAADYIVASGQSLDLGIYLDEDVLNSNIVNGYSVDFSVGTMVDNEGVIEFVEVADKSLYFDITNTELQNMRSLQFKKGTFIEDKPQYVYLKIKVKTKNFVDIVTIAPNDKETKEYIISFYIYDEIQDEDISINHTSMTRYISKYLGAYYSTESRAELQIEMNDALWNYITLNGAGEEVEWKIDDANQANFTTNGRKANVKFDEVLGQTNYIRVVKAYIYQFNKTFEFQCVFNIEKPILSEKIIITSPIEMRDNNELSYYINLKNGETYTVEAKNFSSRGEVTHPYFVIQVFDENGSANKVKDFVEVDQTNNKITIKKIEGSPKMKMVVFAKDVLRFQPASDLGGYNNPSSLILDYEGEEQGRYTGAYFVIDLELSDGTEDNPYLIKNANDFWEIDDAEELRSAHYKIMTTISLNSTTDKNEKIISDFKGSIKTDADNIYTIDGFVLDNNLTNLFRNFKGHIYNVKFVVNYDFNSTNRINENLGTFDINKGTLTDVSVVASGNSILNDSNNQYNFGCLAGVNKGTIQYTKTFGVIGTIRLLGDAEINFGGLVGKNLGTIIGLEQETGAIEDEIVLNSNSGRQNILSSLKIYSELSGNSCLGGVVGFNTYSRELDDESEMVDLLGTIKNAFVQVDIDAKSTSNVGGVIGRNTQQSRPFNLSYDDSYITIKTSELDAILSDDCKKVAIYNVKSASTIKAKNNVGGIVGTDKYGIYIECDYQIVSDTRKVNAIIAENNVGGIAGDSTYGKFAFCSVMSYWWNYAELKEDLASVVTDVADIVGLDYVGGIVGLAHSNSSSVQFGENSIQNKVFVISSSVNAYLQATKSENENLLGNIGGILNAQKGSEDIAIVYNAYFIGMLEGAVYYDLSHRTSNGLEEKVHRIAISNNDKLLYNAVYSINIVEESENFVAKIGNIKDGEEFDIANTKLSVPEYWAWNLNINGGYIFVTADNTNKLPIFDLAPDSIDVTVKNAVAGLERVLQLNYYDFNQNANLTDLELAKLDEKYNRQRYLYKIETIGGAKQNIGLLNIEAEPKGIGTVVVNVKSTNTNVVDITMDGRIIIKSVGETELLFSSLLNPNAGEVENRTIKVIVDYPIGDTFNISASSIDTSKIVYDVENIAKDTSRQYYVMTSGLVKDDLNGDSDLEEYKYRTKTNVHLKVEVSHINHLVIKDYVRISGNEGNQVLKTQTTKLDNKTPFVISVLKKLQESLNPNENVFKVVVTPYNVVNDKEVDYFDEDGTKIKTEFKLSTAEGVSSIFFSYDDAIVYPNDTVYLKAHMKTDLPIIMTGETLKQAELIEMQELFNNLITNALNDAVGGIYNNEPIYIQNILLNISSSNLDEIKFKFLIDGASYDKESQIQTIIFRIEFEQMDLDDEETLEIGLQAKFGNGDKVKYKVIPQRIDKIEIKNYYHKNVIDDLGEVSKVLVQENVLKPDKHGRMIINVAPNNGYYHYLEISDITGNEEILFIQTNSDFDMDLNPSFSPSSDGKGIRIESKPRDTIYILTQTDRTYTSKKHTVEIRAYSKDGTLLYSEIILIDVKMLPEINVAYLLPDGTNGLIVNSNETTGKQTNIAKGVAANFNISTYNATEDLEYTLSAYEADGETENFDLAAKYSFSQEIGNHYLLLHNGVDFDKDIDKIIRISFKTYSYFDNGDFEVAECYIQFKILDFVIHGVSVNRSIDNKTTREIYGYFDEKVTLNFFFDKDDISFYDEETSNDPYWDTVYRNTNLQTIANLYGNGSIHYQIYSILYELNTNSDKYLVINNKQKDAFGNYESIIMPKDNDGNDLIQLLSPNSLIVKDGYNKEKDALGKDVVSDKYLAVTFQVYEESYRTWKISKYQDDTITRRNYYNIDKNYKLNFKKATPWYEPTIVNNEEQFKEMSSGGRYILARDLELFDYVPIDADLMEFDGNGYTITIRSFGKFNDKEINAGLFAKVYENMVVKNTVVNYSTQYNYGEYTLGNVSSRKIEYGDLCNNPDFVNYEVARFGGVTAINEGVITNCKVIGTVALSASTIEQKKFNNSNNADIEFYIGGVVADNNATGFITHSTSELNIYSLANIGGFAYLNEGKIVSSSVEKNTTIYAYKGKSNNTDENLDKIIAVKVGGFVVENKNHISMSYVYLEKYNENDVNKGLIYAKDISAAFAYTNTGEIIDSYTRISAMGVNSNTFSGFVYSNQGTITRAFSFINAGIRPSKDDAMFAVPGTNGLVDCLEFVKSSGSYSNGIETGLTTCEVGARFNKETFKNFAFGDNVSAVWSIEAGEMPVLVSAKEKVENSKGLLSIYSKTSQMVDGVIETTYHVNFATYGTKGNPYIVHDLDSWNTYFMDETTSYYRVVRDIDFLVYGDNPLTSTMTFKGNLQGNNMLLKNIMLYSEDNLYSIGLFSQLVGVRDNELQNSIRNLKLTSTSVWASKTSSVGLLAGIAENFNLYNITIDAQAVIMVGGNAVGGLAGTIHGDFDIDCISSNIGANSTRASTLNNYDIYVSVNNKRTSCFNLNSVYYAGSIAGILDGYNSTPFNINSSKPRDITSNHFMVRNISVNGPVTLLGDTVGAAIGFVGERVYVENGNIEISGALSGAQYSAGFVGENRGVITDVNIKLDTDMFAQSRYVSAGVVGLNLGGLIVDARVEEATIEMSGNSKIVGGIVGRDINGTVNDVYFNGKLKAYFTGGVVGVSYDYNMFVEASSGAGTLGAYCKTNAANLIPSDYVTYKDDEGNIDNYQNIKFSKETFDDIILSTKEYYSYKASVSNLTFREITHKGRVLGLIVGLGHETVGTDVSITLDGADVILNKPLASAIGTTAELCEKDESTGEKIGILLQDINGVQVRYIFKNVRVYQYAVSGDTEPNVAKVVYLTGAEVSTFDSWYEGYSDDFIIFMAAIPVITP